MRDWAKSNAAKKVDWDATWRNWTRNSKVRYSAARRGGGEGLDYLEQIANGERP
jgi:hypothetical protein